MAPTDFSCPQFVGLTIAAAAAARNPVLRRAMVTRVFSTDCNDQTITTVIAAEAMKQLTDIRYASPHADAVVQFGRPNGGAAINTHLGGPSDKAHLYDQVPAVPWTLVNRSAANETEMEELQALGGGDTPLIRDRQLRTKVRLQFCPISNEQALISCALLCAPCP